MLKLIDGKVLVEAWRLRQIGVYTMREIAEKLHVNRELLIQELEQWLKERKE